MKALCLVCVWIAALSAVAGELAKFAAECERRRLPYADRIDAMWARLSEPASATNELVALEGYQAIAKWCRTPPYRDLIRLDWRDTLAASNYPKLMPVVLGSKTLPLIKKVPFVVAYARYLCDEERYDEAEKLVREHLKKQAATSQKERSCEPSLLYALADVCVWADRLDSALAVVREVEAINHDEGAALGLTVARQFCRDDLVRAFSSELSGPACFAAWSKEAAPEYVRARAVAYIQDSSNPPAERLAAFVNIFATDNSASAHKCLDVLLGLSHQELSQASFDFARTFRAAFIAGDWRRVVAYFRLIEKCGGMKRYAADAKVLRMHVLSLANLGEKESAAKLCEEFASTRTGSGADVMRFRYLAEMMRGNPIGGMLDRCELSDREKALILQSAGRFALTMGLSAYAEELAKAYAACFRRRENRSLQVRFVEDPIRSIADWRVLRSSLQKGVCDQPFGTDVEALVTDVNTQRTIVETGKEDNLAAQVEISAVCDRYALHLFLRVADPKARDVEHGFANGIRTEMYFAPGDNVPYQCLGAQPLKGVTFMMNTLYDSRWTKRLDIGNGFRSEVAFSDDDYVTHLVFDWSNFFDKLPTIGGGHYRFECLCWAPGGSKTWAGSRGIHHSSDWGELVFDLSAKQLTEIRRELVLSYYKGWRELGAKKSRASVPYDVFRMWADRTIGDPEFYTRCLQSLDAELSTFAARVKPGMDEMTVNEVFEKALPSWIGLRHILDARRKDYLGDKLIEMGE